MNNRLLKILGVGFGIAVTIGGTIGTGILRKPGPIAEALGDPWLIMLVWVIVSLYALTGTLCTVELGTSLPKAGGWYVFTKRAFGPYPGFVVGINSWLGTCAALGFGVYTLSEYISLLFPVFHTHENTMAVLVLTFLAGFHWLGLSLASTFQNVMSLIKGCGLLLFILVCFFCGDPVNTRQTAEVTKTAFSGFGWVAPFLFSLQAVFYTFDGWHSAAYFTEEDRDPTRNLPRSMLGGVLIIIFIYLMTNAALLYVMPLDQLAGSKLAAADAMSLLFGGSVGKVVTAFLIVSILGIVNAQMLFNPRVIYSMSRDGLFLKQGSRVNQRGTPALAMPLTAAMAILFILTGKETSEKLSDVATFFFVMGYISGFASLIRLRQTQPDLPRPWRTPLYPLLPLLMLILSLGFLIMAAIQDPDGSVYAVGFLLLSYPLYRLTVRLNT